MALLIVRVLVGVLAFAGAVFGGFLLATESLKGVALLLLPMFACPFIAFLLSLPDERVRSAYAGTGFVIAVLFGVGGFVARPLGVLGPGGSEALPPLGIALLLFAPAALGYAVGLVLIYAFFDDE